MRLIRLTLAVWIMRAGNALALAALHMARRYERGTARFEAAFALYGLARGCQAVVPRLAPAIVETPEQRLGRMGLLPRR